MEAAQELSNTNDVHAEGRYPRGINKNTKTFTLRLIVQHLGDVSGFSKAT